MPKHSHTHTCIHTHRTQRFMSFDTTGKLQEWRNNLSSPFFSYAIFLSFFFFFLISSFPNVHVLLLHQGIPYYTANFVPYRFFLRLRIIFMLKFISRGFACFSRPNKAQQKKQQQKTKGKLLLRCRSLLN